MIIFARISLFTIYFWFGILKVIGLSPANPLVMALQEKTLPFIGFEKFIILFGLFEMLIGLLFLFPKMLKVNQFLFGFHMLTAFMPLFLVSGLWQGFMVPTLEAQYIIKNLALISMVLFLRNQNSLPRSGILQ